eukprot:TRINITY_DN10677_c0_g1_i1.p1 TRINITY_DN10677_c0_g1~~TRINITY_DN10677_c0_g1_i1.p1  ORF type:complete len:432 (-),score=83.05 TRINITY_DN10677_c0_g1_i1:401-1696(-)
MSSGSAYANLAPDARGHCSWFLARTNKEHQATMDHPFMKTIYAKTFDAGAYASYLCGQFFLFSELERLCAPHKAQVPLSAVYDEALHRSNALLADLRFWGGDRWQSLLSSPTAAASRYLQRLKSDSSDPWLLLCHHFLNYNAVLSGGQFLGGMVSARAQAAPPTGAEMYAFPPQCMPTHGRVQEYIDKMDQLPISNELRNRMLECMRAVYKLLLEMFDEAYAMAPVAGVSFSASKSGSHGSTSQPNVHHTSTGSTASGSASSEKTLPPPLDPADKHMTMRELAKHEAIEAATQGLPILTAVLGRVYDVTPAKDLFGAGGPYEMFCGHDGTYNLAVMSLKKKTLDVFSYELDDEEKQCLADWIAYFDHKYGRPVAQVKGQRHSIELAELPRAQTIPFSFDDDEEDSSSKPAPPEGHGSVSSAAVASPPASKL